MEKALKLRCQYHVHEDRREQEGHDEALLKIIEGLGATGKFGRVARLHFDIVQLRLQRRNGIADTDPGFQIRYKRDLTLAGLPLDRGWTDVLVERREI